MSRHLHQQLREATRSVHTALERGPLVSALIRGTLAHDTYVALLRNLHGIYTALEAALDDGHEDAAVRSVFVDELRRAPRLARDLDSIHGAGWPDALPLQPATNLYVDRLAAIRKDGPAALLVAHVYVRYLGDLNGGQTLKRCVQASFGPQHPTAFYEFGPPETVERLASALRVALQSLDPAPSIGGRIVEEAVWAFDRHRELFTELVSS